MFVHFPAKKGNGRFPRMERMNRDGRRTENRCTTVKDRKWFRYRFPRSGTFTAGAPKVLFSGFPSMNVDSGISYDITADGRDFVTTTPVEGTTFKSISLVLNWTSELRTLAPSEK